MSSADSPAPASPAPRCPAVREARNNYDEAAHCDLRAGHAGTHVQTSPWQESWLAPASDAPAPPREDADLLDSPLTFRTVTSDLPLTMSGREWLRALSAASPAQEATPPRYYCSTHGYDYDESCCGEDFRQTFLGPAAASTPQEGRVITAVRKVLATGGKMASNGIAPHYAALDELRAAIAAAAANWHAATLGTYAAMRPGIEPPATEPT